MNVSSSRLSESIELMKSVEKDLADGRYEDAARKRREALDKLRSAFSDADHATAEEVHRARDLPPELRGELLQSAEEAYPPGYEGLLKSYYKSLSTGDK
jgi:ATP phosphoribosyltransferase regulatory subunit HisZ